MKPKNKIFLKQAATELLVCFYNVSSDLRLNLMYNILIFVYRQIVFNSAGLIKFIGFGRYLMGFVVFSFSVNDEFKSIGVEAWLKRTLA
ncbi:hypothetical protein [Shewanella sediminis]|uniref:hypothetical protein n=1 Tax=Shewanella sediminis TaxID=271097 RepID=UPI000157216E|nr:hypothetical protein [Shewanella sediminis]